MVVYNSSADSFVRGLYRESFRPKPKTPIPVWARKEVELDPTSPYPGKYKIENSPQLAEPFATFQDDTVRHQITVGPNQGGRTKGMEVACIWAAIYRPGPMQWNTDTNEKAGKHAEERFWPMALQVQSFADILPAKADDRRKTKVLFRNGLPFTIQGANDTNAQQDSISVQFNDEIYKWKLGMLNQFHKRCNVSYAATYKIWDASIASDEGHDFHEEWQKSSRAEWSFCCRKCGHVQPFKFGGAAEIGGLKWDANETTKPGGEWEFDAMRETVRYMCERVGCGEEYADTHDSREQMNKSARYVHADPKKKLKGHRFNALSVQHPGITWGAWVEEFLLANRHYKNFGDITLLKLFWTRRMAEFWEESRFANPTDGKLKADYLLGEPNFYIANAWPADTHGEVEWGRFMAVDKQEANYYFVIRAVKDGGASRLIERGTASSYDELEQIAKRFRVRPRKVLIDCSYELREVFAECVKRGWTALKGDDRENFPHRVEVPANGGGTKVVYVNRPYSEEKWGDPSMGKREQARSRRGTLIRQRLKLCRYYHWSNLSIKNLLNALKHGRASIYWAVPEDVSQVSRSANYGGDYLAQINSEVRYRKLSRGGMAVYWWSNAGRDGKARKKANHFWDCECMILVALVMAGLIDLDRYKTNEVTETNVAFPGIGKDDEAEAA